MPTNQTENYQLSQWVKSDQVKMEDFNADNAKMDEVLKAHADALLGKGNCQIEVRRVSGVSFNNVNPLQIQFPRVPAAFILFDQSTMAVGMAGSSYAAVVMHAQYNAAFIRFNTTWSGNRLTVSLPPDISYTQYNIIIFYAQ